MKTKDLAQNICPTVSVWLFRGPGQDWLFTLVGFAPWKSTGPGTLKPPGAIWSKSSGAQDQPQSPPRVRMPSQGLRRELALSVPMAGAPSLFLSTSFCSPPAWQIKASSGQVWCPAWAAATGLLQGICQQLVFWSAGSRASLTPDRPCLACCHLPWYDVRWVVDTRFDVVSDDEMLHPWGQDLGDEGERVRESWRAGSPAQGGSRRDTGSSANMDPGGSHVVPSLLLRLYVHHGAGFPARLPWEDREMGGQAGKQRSFLLAWVYYPK